MADPRQTVAVIQNPSNQEGEVLDRVQQGQAVASKNGIMGFAYADQSGNAIAVQLTAEGKVPVDVAGAGTAMRAKGELAAGSLTLAAVTNASLSLTANKVYRKLNCVVACRNDSLFQLVQVDDATETVLAEFVLGPGQHTFQYNGADDEITAGSTGAQTLKVMAKNFEKMSSLRATITAVEQVAGA